MKYRGEIQGLRADVLTGKIEKVEFAIDYTADAIGKTLSIGDMETNIQYTIPFDELFKIIGGNR